MLRGGAGHVAVRSCLALSRSDVGVGAAAGRCWLHLLLKARAGAAAAALDNVDGFEELGGAKGVAAFTIGAGAHAGTYGIAASMVDDGVQIRVDVRTQPARTAAPADRPAERRAAMPCR